MGRLQYFLPFFWACARAVTAYDLELRVTSVPRNEDFELIWSRIPAHGDPIPFQLVMVMDAPSRTFSVMTTETLGSTEMRTFPAPTATGTYRIVGVRGTDTVTAFPGIDDGSSTILLVTSDDDEVNPSVSSISPTPTIPPSTTLDNITLSSINSPTSSSPIQSPSKKNATAIIIASTLGSISLILMLLVLFIVIRRRSRNTRRLLEGPGYSSPQMHGIPPLNLGRQNGPPSTGTTMSQVLSRISVPANTRHIGAQQRIDPFLSQTPTSNYTGSSTSHGNSRKNPLPNDLDRPPSYTD